MVQILRHDVSDDGYTDAGILNARRLLGIRLSFGDKLTDRFPSDITISIRSEGEPNDYFVAGPMPVISDRVKEVLERYNANVEYFPLDVSLADGSKPPSQYYHPNIIDIVDCLDWQASRYTPEQDYATALRSVVFREDACDSSPLFIVARTIPCLICLQNPLGTALLESGCKGIVLKSPSEWRNPAYPT